MKQINLRKSALPRTLQLLGWAALLGLPLTATTVLNTYPDYAIVTNGYLKGAQTFLVGTDNVLSSFEFRTFNAPGQSSQMQIFAWDSNGPTGSALFTSQTFARGNAIEDFTVSNINLTLNQGSLYGAVIDSFGYSGPNYGFNLNQNSYTGGNLWLVSGDTPNSWNNYASFGYNLTFQATLTNTALPTGVPEPASILLFVVGLVTVAAFRKHMTSTIC